MHHLLMQVAIKLQSLQQEYYLVEWNNAKTLLWNKGEINALCGIAQCNFVRQRRYSWLKNIGGWIFCWLYRSCWSILLIKLICLLLVRIQLTIQIVIIIPSLDSIFRRLCFQSKGVGTSWHERGYCFHFMIQRRKKLRFQPQLQGSLRSWVN